MEMTAGSFVSPKQFLADFIQVATERHDELAKLWFKKKPYTDLMRAEVLPQVAKGMGLHCHKEYYSIDSVFYRE